MSSLEECIKTKSVIECLGKGKEEVVEQPDWNAKPSGSGSILGQAIMGNLDKDPTIATFDKPKENIAKGLGDIGKALTDFFGGFAKFFQNKWFWIVALLVLLLIVGKKIFG